MIASDVLVALRFESCTRRCDAPGSSEISTIKAKAPPEFNKLEIDLKWDHVGGLHGRQSKDGLLVYPWR